MLKFARQGGPLDEVFGKNPNYTEKLTKNFSKGV